jgi:hypothetical protein
MREQRAYKKLPNHFIETDLWSESTYCNGFTFEKPLQRGHAHQQCLTIFLNTVLWKESK